MKMSKEVINKYIYKSDKLIHEQNLTMEQIFNYSYVLNKHGVAFEYFDFNNKYRSLSYKDVKKNTFRYASVISKALEGCEKHNVIILKYTNSPEWCEFFYAILMAGYKPLLVNAKTDKDGVNNLIRQTKAVAVVSDDPFTYDVMKLRVDIVASLPENKNFTPSWENEVIFCSSGTTGDVKLMVFDGENLCHQVAASLEMPNYTNDIMYPGKIKILGMIPFHHIFGFVAVFLWYSFYGKEIVFPKSMSSKDIQDVCINSGITHVYSVPLFWDSLARQYLRTMEMADEKTKGYLLALLEMNLHGGKKLSSIVVKKIQKSLLGNKVRMCISGGGYISEETISTINGIGYPLYNGFGMTELGVTSVELSKCLEERLACSVGHPFHGVTYAFKNNEKSGELLVKSAQIHKKEIIGGKLQNAKLDANGFFHTGDIACFDEDGKCYIKGRIKDIIINANGENIFPDEIELYFKDLKNVLAFSVMGIKNEKKDHVEDVTLVLQVEDSVTPEILENIKAEVSLRSKKLPNGVVIDKIYFTAVQLPTANNFKVKRNAIKKAIEEKSKDFAEIGSKKIEVVEKLYDDKITKEIVEPLCKIYAKVLVLPESKIKNNSHFINDLGGDSMKFFELITEVESQFNIVVPDEKYITLSTISAFVDLINELKNFDK